MKHLSDEDIYNTPKILLMAVAEEIKKKAKKREIEYGFFTGYTWNEGRIISYVEYLKGGK